MREAHVFFKLLSDPLRVRILGMLRSGPMSVYDLRGEIEVPQPTLSRHLGHLRRAGLVHSDSQAQWRYYSINPDHRDLLERVWDIEKRWERPLRGEVARMRR